jgi:hypothetical protein
MGVGAEPIISDEVAFHALAGDEYTTACSKMLFGKLKNAISWYPKWLENQFKDVPTWLTDCISSSLSARKSRFRQLQEPALKNWLPIYSDGN